MIKSDLLPTDNAPSDTSPMPEAAQPKVRLEFLDGIRGMAALYVLLYHLAIDLDGQGLPHRLLSLLGLFRYGHFAVDVFIVLSGYSLMIPVVQDRQGLLRGGIVGYLKRRAMRILPPYYVALFGSILIILLMRGYPHTALGNFAGYNCPSISAVAHLLLLQNLSPQWIDQINSPLWSVATEWQIYFFFPLLLLPLYRKFGVTVAVLVAFLLGMLPHWLIGSQLDRACFWFLGLFALGMLGAVLSFSKADSTGLVARFPYGIFSLLCLAAVKVMLFHKGEWLGDPGQGWWRLDPIVGLATAGLLTSWAKTQSRHQTHGGIRFFSSRPLVLLGTFSYSLYLTHAPILIMMHRFLLSTHLTPKTCSYVLLIVTVPVCLAMAYLFHLAFERPFMPGRPRTERQAEKAAVLSPAP